MASLGVAVAWHTYRFVGAKLATSQFPPFQKVGPAIAGVFTFGVPA